jgi:hypothetical protein
MKPLLSYTKALQKGSVPQILRHLVCPAIVGAVLTRTLDVGVVVAPHRVCGEPRIDDRLRYFAVVVVGRFELDDDVLIRGVVAEPIDDAASSDLLAGEGFEIDRATIFHVDGLGLRPGREKQHKGEY